MRGRKCVPLQNRVQEFITQFEIANECVINLEVVVVAAFVIVVCIRPVCQTLRTVFGSWIEAITYTAIYRVCQRRVDQGC